eukprot:gene3033-15424_t
MSGFKKPKAYVPGKAAVGISMASKKAMADDMGFSSSGSGSGSESDGSQRSEEEDDGVSFMAYLSLQKSLKTVTDQRIKMGDELQKTRVELRKTRSQLDREQRQKRTHIAILEEGQSKQLSDKDGQIADLQLALEEMEEAHTQGSTKSDGIRQMTSMISGLSNEKREYFQKEAELMAELNALRATVDPKLQIKLAEDSASGSGASSAQVMAFQAEIQKLKDQIELADAAKSAASADTGRRRGSGITTAASERLEADLADAKRDTANAKAELNEAKASMAKMQAMASSGASGASQAKAMNDELASQLQSLQQKERDAEAAIEKLKASVKSEEAAKDRAESEMAELKGNLESQAAAGADASTVLQAQLTSEKSANAANKERAAAAETELASLREESTGLKSKMAAGADEAANELRAAREQHASAIQNAQAEAAASLAEAKQRSSDEMKDLKVRLGSFGKIVEPMAATLKVLSSNYRKLRTETRELSATIAPAVKQVRRDLLKTLAEIDAQYKEMLVKYRKEMKLRKKLHNELVDLKGNIRVFGQDGTGPQAEIVCTGDKSDDQIMHVKSKGKMVQFELDTVFPPTATQDQVFNSGIADLITSVIDGYNVCIFAYGQTGSGKTYSMEGNDGNPGLNRRALGHLFNLCEEKKSDWTYELEVSVMEIYNEKLRDLLCGSKAGAELAIKHGRAGPMVPGLTRRAVRTPDQVQDAFTEAKSIRATSSTKMNDQSSRSHCLLVVYVTGTNLSTGVQSTGKLNLIDLAGSERVGKSGALDDAKRLKEATNINKSLSSLGDVIHALGAKQKHVPYRNSKLTHLLQDSLGGAAKTLMLVQISPVEKNVSESVCSLNFAKRVRSVELGGAKKTTESAEVSTLKKRIRELESA